MENKKQNRRYKIMLTSLILILILGIGIIFFPVCIRLIRERNRASVVDEYLVEQINEQTRLKEAAICNKYNQLITYKQNKLLVDEEGNALDFTLLGTYEERLAHSQVMGVVEIPSIGLKIPFYHGTDQETLARGAGHMQETSLPIGGESTHAVISAHNGDPYSNSFGQIDRLKEGDLFNVTCNGKTMTYKVDQIKKVEPTETDDTKVIEGEDHVTLLTCTPRNINSHRLLVRGIRTDDIATEDIKTGWSETTIFVILSVTLIILIISEIAYVVVKEKKRKKLLEASDETVVEATPT